MMFLSASPAQMQLFRCSVYNLPHEQSGDMFSA